MDGARRFVYPLASLMRLRGAERDAAAAQVAAAVREVERRSRDCDDLARAMARTEEELRERRAAGRALAVEEDLRAQRFLELRRSELEERRRALASASAELARRREELDAKRRDARALEKQRARQHARFVEDETRAALKAADDQWLRRKGS